PSFVAPPAGPVAVNVPGRPASASAVAVSVFVPAVVPSVQEVAAAIPPALVSTAVVGLTVPPPLATAKMTGTPATGLPLASVTIKIGRAASRERVAAVGALPAFTANWIATPAVTGTCPDVTPASPTAAELSVHAP